MKYILSFSFSFLLLISCQEDKTSFYKSKLHGHYDFIKAYRNGKSTNTLQSGYFVFDSSTMKFNSNLIGSDKPLAYNIENSRLKLAADTPMSFNITEMDENGKLVMKGLMQGFKMEFHLLRNDTIHMHHEH